jgi:hypothetical protein
MFFMKRSIILFGITVFCVSTGCIEQKVEVETGSQVVCNECDEVIRDDVKKVMVPISQKSVYSVSRSRYEICYSCAMEREKNNEKYFIGNISSKIYHNPECHAAKKIKRSNRVYFRSRANAKSGGYVACQICKP